MPPALEWQDWVSSSTFSMSLRFRIFYTLITCSLQISPRLQFLFGRHLLHPLPSLFCPSLLPLAMEQPELHTGYKTWLQPQLYYRAVKRCLLLFTLPHDQHCWLFVWLLFPLRNHFNELSPSSGSPPGVVTACSKFSLTQIGLRLLSLNQG